ncbi:MAG: prepilin-type N-terminal cleavage/methylation domain-containing protein [Planctomycetes bacterium]|nr:prepilin-type N-terminal cleavage/methylation domain-containing protein [Planctomycetota bacterium]
MTRFALVRARPRRAGFTILEVVLALAILLFGMVAVLGLLTTGAALTRTAQLRTEAAAATEAVLADLEETLFPFQPDVAANGGDELGAPKPIVDRPLPGSSGVVYSATAKANPARAKEWRVDVELTWTSAGVRRERRFTTLLVQELPFGERLRRQFIEGGAPPASTAPVPPGSVAPAPPGSVAPAPAGAAPTDAPR